MRDFNLYRRFIAFFTSFLILQGGFILASEGKISEAASSKGGVSENEGAGVERYAVYIGSNIGGKNNQRLLYAGSDALAFQKTMSDIGGVPNSNSILLLDPAKDDVDEAMETISEIVESKKNLKRTEFIFYYSGHSDESSLLLGKTSYGYSELKQAISKVPTDVHVVILDSCYSGNFIRSKGGSRQKPFLMDDSSVVKGHAYLSSSSSIETSQESDEIGSSFFTNAMITGLRGAADSSGDKKVSLNELYSYAFNETLSKTENSLTGPQHPNYNITLVGSGDLVLSDISNSDSILMLSKELSGRVIIRDKNGKLVSEINKTSDKPIYLALESGTYGVTVIGEMLTLQGTFTLSAKKTYTLSNSELSPLSKIANRTRGENGDGEEVAGGDQAEGAVSSAEGKNNTSSVFDSIRLGSPDDRIWEDNFTFDYEKCNKKPEDFIFLPFEFSLLFNEFNLGLGKEIVTPCALGLIRVHAYEVNGIMASGAIGQAVYVNGFQGAGVCNFALDVHGGQGAGTFNFARDVNGIQGSGGLNFARDVTGVQGTGTINIARNVKYVQGCGVGNIATGKAYGVQGSGVFNYAAELKGVQGTGVVNITKGQSEGIQGAGVMNYAGSIRGVQGSGVLNIAAEESSGIQGASILNVSRKDFDGVQAGLINYCGGNAGLQIGLINIAKNGLCEFGLSYTSNQRAKLTFNSGVHYLYGIFGAALPLNVDYDSDSYNKDELDKETEDFISDKYVDLVMGLGSRFNASIFNFDIEALSNSVIIPNEKSEWYPSLRASVGITPIKHINIFGGCNVAVEWEDNHKAFERHTSNLKISHKDYTLHPEFDVGVRVSVN